MKATKERKATPGKSSPFFSGKGEGLFGLQRKTEIGRAGDIHEREADFLADQVISRSRENTFFRPSEKPTLAKEVVQKKPLAERVTPFGVQAKSWESIQDAEQEEQVQMKPEEEEQIQMQPERDKADNHPVIPPGFEADLENSKGSGLPLPSHTKEEMESAFGADFSSVRVHTDSTAIQMSRQIGAQAFTHGNDIYFNEGMYDTTSDLGRHLLAHELTHTLQQGASAGSQRVQRQAEETGSPPIPVNEISPSPHGKITETPQGFKMELENFKVKANINPAWDSPPFKLPRPGERSTRQIPVWRRAVRPLVVSSVEQLTSEVDTEENMYTLTLKNKPGISLAGTRAQLANEVFIPYWDREENVTTFQVEHLIDWQVAGGNKNVDDINNLILLDSQTNNTLGGRILNDKNEHIQRVLNHYESAGVTRSVSVAMNSYEIIINSISPTIPVNGTILEKKDFETAASNPIRNQLIDIRSFEVPPGSFLLKTSRSGGGYIIPYNAAGYETGSFTVSIEGDAENHAITSITLDPVVAPDSVDKKESSVYEVDSLGTDQFMARGLKSRLRNFFELKLLSPIVLDEEQLEISSAMNIYAVGKVLPSIPILRDADIDIVIEGKDIRLRKLFNTGEIDVPAPFEISESGLEIFVGTGGAGAAGEVVFGINNVGQGRIGATVSTTGGFELEGIFGFDSELFDPAEIRIEYKENSWTIGGTIAIPEGKVQGIKNATISVTYSEGLLTANGEAELDVPGIEKGNMEVIYGEEGFSISGNFALREDIPGIREGNVSARVAKSADEEGYSVTVSGSARPDIPGVDTTLLISYEEGALTIEGTAAYSRGMLAGTVHVGATNRPVNEAGEPAGEPDATLRVYGGGNLTLTLAPWLQATAGVSFLENGEMEVTGRIGIPDTVELFERKSIDRNLFTAPAIEIPLFAIPLGPRSVGVVARITGGLDFSSGFGPGQLRELSAEIIYNPDREEETTLVGRGNFVIPADAGLTLRGDLGLGMSVGFASLTGGIEVAGALGLAGEALAVVLVNWSPGTGIAIDAMGSITVNPKFTFDVNAFARASLDLWLFSLSETWRYNLLSFSWGPDIQFGILFPIHYREGEPFDMSFNDITVIYPEIDVIAMARGLAGNVKDQLFD